MIAKIKSILPQKIRKPLSNIWNLVKIYYYSSIHKQLLKEVRKKEKIKIAFLLVDESIWKYDYVYRLFSENPKYELCVFNCPPVQYGDELMKERMDKAFETFKSKGYNIVDTRLSNGGFLDVKNTYKPDLVFFCTPWSHTVEQYQIENFLDTLTVYVPYGFKNSNLYEYHFNKSMMNYVWRFFVETEIHKKLSYRYSLSRANNVIVSGFPGLDIFLDSSFKANEEVWKKQENRKKKIIWAPHHTIPGANNALSYSTFLDYADFILDLANEFKNDIQIAFKPHPVLRRKLNDIWGIEKTETYFSQWENLSNGQIEEGAYIDLFATSDAMIHDSGSFVIEYLYTRKPVQFLISSEKVKEEFNEIGKEALKNIALAYNKQDIRKFVEEVIKGEDIYKNKRNSFFENLVIPPNNKMASENIYDYINNKLEYNGK